MSQLVPCQGHLYVARLDSTDTQSPPKNFFPWKIACKAQNVIESNPIPPRELGNKVHRGVWRFEGSRFELILSNEFFPGMWLLARVNDLELPANKLVTRKALLEMQGKRTCLLGGLPKDYQAMDGSLLPEMVMLNYFPRP